MKCYFCGAGASVCCLECNRNVCRAHSQRSGRKFLCLECALGGPDGVYQEVYRQVLELLKYRDYKCSICNQLGIEEKNLFGSLSDLCLSSDLKDKLKRQLLRVGVIFCQFGQCRNYHSFCPKHHPKPVITIVDGDERGGNTSCVISRSVWESLGYKCPVCKEWWSVRGKCVRKASIEHC